MSDREKRILASMSNALGSLDDKKREYIAGFADGVVAAAESKSSASGQAQPN